MLRRMTLDRPAASSAAFVRSIHDLTRIRTRGVEICVWRRPPISELASYVATRLLPERLDLRASGSASEATVDRLLDGLPEGEGRRVLRDDVAALCRAIAEAAEARRLDLRLERIDDDMCRRFHVDHYPCRLLCTYAGPATQWLENADVIRDRLGVRGRLLPHPETNMIRPGGRIRRLRAFDVAILKGDLWNDGASLGAVHRSPPVQRRNVKRLLLRIDVLRRSARRSRPALGVGAALDQA